MRLHISLQGPFLHTTPACRSETGGYAMLLSQLYYVLSKMQQLCSWLAFNLMDVELHVPHTAF